MLAATSVVEWLAARKTGLAVGTLLAALVITGINLYRAGYATAQAAATAEQQQSELARLQAVIDSAQALTTAANEASRKLAATIGARQQADATATREIRNALAATAALRADCVFDAGVMQQLEAARARAAAAAAGGVGDAVPAAR